MRAPRWQTVVALLVTVGTVIWTTLWLVATRNPLAFWEAGVGTLVLGLVAAATWRWALRTEREERYRLGDRGVVDDGARLRHRGLSGEEQPPKRW